MITVDAEGAISNLPESFGRLWESAEDACEGLPLSRSLTHNLIVVTNPERAGATHKLIDGLLNRHPCRALVVVIDPDECELTAQLTGLIRTQRKVRALVLEKLTIEAGWGDFPKLANLIRPLLVNDIGSSLFWAAQLPESLDQISALAALVDRTIVDSTLFAGDNWRSLGKIQDCEPLDLAWLRIGPWRRALAETFEHFEWQPEQPETDITLVHGMAFGSLGASRCLAAWLTEQLSATVRLVEEEGDGPDNEPWLLDLEHGPSHVQIRHLRTESRLLATITLKDRCLLPTYTQATRGSRSQLLAAALDLSW